MPKYKLKVNGETKTVNVEADMPLLWVLRENLDLAGTKFGCGKGFCGACSVHVNGSVVRSCQLPVEKVRGKEITTVEGLSKGGELHPLQKAWCELDTPQCGYCQPGQLMAAAALLKQHPDPTDSQIDVAMTNLCRCGSYDRIRRAIHKAAKV
jgi:isoquinoline 1-oxidoreductase alpha subunit